jgi:two-component system cell cycle sensor histidine kinase/response regulator CckA
MTHIASRQLTLLVVDDEPVIPTMLADALQEPGFRVLTATQADKAIEIFHQNLGKVDLVLLDVQMYPTDGLQLMARLRKIDPQVRIAFMSGSPSEEYVDQIREEGSSPIFSKPFASLAELAFALREQMEKESP